MAFGACKQDTLKAGDRYKFVVDGTEYPDPASLSQPEGVHGASQAIDIKSLHDG
jgi:maltooligosyltrehalose trehalohydrolase